MFLSKLGFSELVQRLFEKMTFFLVDPLIKYIFILVNGGGVVRRRREQREEDDHHGQVKLGSQLASQTQIGGQPPEFPHQEGGSRRAW